MSGQAHTIENTCEHDGASVYVSGNIMTKNGYTNHISKVSISDVTEIVAF